MPHPVISTQYLLTQKSVNWIVDVYVNDQPFGTSAKSTMCDLVPFVVDGVNRVRLEAQYVPDISWFPAQQQDACELVLEAVDHAAGKSVVLGRARAIAGDGHSINEAFEFTASVPVRWGWQDADELGPLTEEDKHAIREEIRTVAELIGSCDFQTLFDKRLVRAWQGALRPHAPWIPAGCERYIISDPAHYCIESKWTVAIADLGSLVFRPGTKLVTVSMPPEVAAKQLKKATDWEAFDPADSEAFDAAGNRRRIVPILSAEPVQDAPASDTNPDAPCRIEAVDMIRQDGTWRMLCWEWWY